MPEIGQRVGGTRGMGLSYSPFGDWEEKLCFFFFFLMAKVSLFVQTVCNYSQFPEEKVRWMSQKLPILETHIPATCCASLNLQHFCTFTVQMNSGLIKIITTKRKK